MNYNLLKLSGIKLANLIRNRELTSYEVVETHIEQIKKVNPELNAVVKERFEDARGEAKLADKTILDKHDDLPEYFGVPCTLKENFAFKGFPQTGGLLYRRNYIASNYATVIARMLKSGLIPMGFTNVSELCMWMESNNPVYGRTNNPYNSSRIVGGSSGGEGAIIGSGASPFGLGADIGGSIRLPAFFNGVYGHKPTGGLVPGTGQHPMASGAALRYLTTGPICRRAADLLPLLKIMTGPDGIDDGCEYHNIRWDESYELKNIRILSISNNGTIPVDRELMDIQNAAVDKLKTLGARVYFPKFERLKKSFEIWASMLSAAGGPSFEEMLMEGKSSNAFIELGKLFFGASEHTIPAIMLAIIEKVPKILPKQANKILDEGMELKKEMKEILGDDGVILYPTYTSVAPAHNIPILKPMDWIYTAIINVMELPSTQVPLGLNKDKLPLGFQIIGNHGNDPLTIFLGNELEKEFGGWIPPDKWFC